MRTSRLQLLETFRESCCTVSRTAVFKLCHLTWPPVVLWLPPTEISLFVNWSLNVAWPLLSQFLETSGLNVLENLSLSPPQFVQLPGALFEVDMRSLSKLIMLGTDEWKQTVYLCSSGSCSDAVGRSWLKLRMRFPVAGFWCEHTGPGHSSVIVQHKSAYNGLLELCFQEELNHSVQGGYQMKEKWKKNYIKKIKCGQNNINTEYYPDISCCQLHVSISSCSASETTSVFFTLCTTENRICQRTSFGTASSNTFLLH